MTRILRHDIQERERMVNTDFLLLLMQARSVASRWDDFEGFILLFNNLLQIKYTKPHSFFVFFFVVKKNKNDRLQKEEALKVRVTKDGEVSEKEKVMCSARQHCIFV